MYKNEIASESVCVGHPDWVADSISDAILQAYYEQDPDSHVACETLVTTNFVLVAGEIKSKATVNVPLIIQETIKALGYKDHFEGFSAEDVQIINKLHDQSEDIDMGVTKENPEMQGAGDQGFMVGYACSETEDYMPLGLTMAQALTDRLTFVRESGLSDILLPDGKAQVVLDYTLPEAGDDVCSSCKIEEEKYPKLKTVLVSCQHKDIPIESVLTEIEEKVIIPVLKAFDYSTDSCEILINPTGKFVIGGPNGDTGLTGRKLAVENYGPYCPIGGGASAGKDLSKTDRAGAYAARYIAKNIVAAGIANICEVHVSYAIGVAEPTHISVDTHNSITNDYSIELDDKVLSEMVTKLFDLRPFAIREWITGAGINFNEVRRQRAYGNSIFPWEQLDKVDEIKAYTKEYKN